MSDALERWRRRREQREGEPGALLSAVVGDFLAAIDSRTVHLARQEFVVGSELLEASEGVFVFLTSDGLRRELPWSDVLNLELIKRRIRMATPDQEALRFGMHLLANLQYADDQFGTDFTNAVLWEVVKTRFGRVSAINETLDAIPHDAPTQGAPYLACVTYIETCVDGIGNSLVVELGYDNQRTAFAILSGAVLFVLERRHRLSFRRPVAETTDALLSTEQIRERLSRSRQLLQEGFVDAALLLAWSAAEAAMQRRWEFIGAPRATTLGILRKLHADGVLDDARFAQFSEMFRLRSSLVHGVQTPLPVSAAVEDLIRQIEQLSAQL
jgi:hypothetical protein